MILRKWLEKTPLQKVRVSFVANNVWMIVNHLEGIDPESISFKIPMLLVLRMGQLRLLALSHLM